MLTPGHIAATYLLTVGAEPLGVHLTQNEIIGVILAGNIIDLDLLLGFKNGKFGEAHHRNITHTPIGVTLIWIGIQFIFQLSISISLLVLCVLLLHLVLDDLGYWLYKLKLISSPINPQINWLYPIRQFQKSKMITSNSEALSHYFKKGRVVFAIEVMLVIVALMTLIM